LILKTRRPARLQLTIQNSPFDISRVHAHRTARRHLHHRHPGGVHPSRLEKPVKRRQFIKQTQAEMAQLETALDSYKAAYGFYPPGNPNSPFFNPLYFELLGTTTNYSTTAFYYQTLDGSAINLSAVNATASPRRWASAVSSTAPRGSGEDAPAAKNFLPELKPKQIGLNITNRR
jgi:hypothetical protein